MKFQTTDTDYKQHNGKQVEVIRDLIPGFEYDLESTRMYECRLDTGEIIQVFADELIQDIPTEEVQ